MDHAQAIALAVGAFVFGFAKVAVPPGLAGSMIELAGARFGMPRVQRFGHACKSFFADVPGLVTGK
jgi:hypothetical protein